MHSLFLLTWLLPEKTFTLRGAGASQQAVGEECRAWSHRPEKPSDCACGMHCWGWNVLEVRPLNLFSKKLRVLSISVEWSCQNGGKYYCLRKVHPHQNSKHELFNIGMSFYQISWDIKPQFLYQYTDHKVCEKEKNDVESECTCRWLQHDIDLSIGVSHQILTRNTILTKRTLASVHTTSSMQVWSDFRKHLFLHFFNFF